MPGFPPSSSGRPSCSGSARIPPTPALPRGHIRNAWRPFRQWAAQTSIVLVDDVADAFAKALDRPGIEGRCFNLSSPGASRPRNISKRSPGVGESDPAQAAVAPNDVRVAGGEVVGEEGGRRKDPFPRWADCNGRSFASPFDCSVTEAAPDWHPESDRSVLLSGRHRAGGSIHPLTQETPRFADAMVLHQTEHGFDANLNEHWTIGPKIHGGVMLALCAKAAREAYGSFEPVAVSADFLAAPTPGRCSWSPPSASGAGGSAWSTSNSPRMGAHAFVPWRPSGNPSTSSSPCCRPTR